MIEAPMPVGSRALVSVRHPHEVMRCGKVEGARNQVGAGWRLPGSGGRPGRCGRERHHVFLVPEQTRVGLSVAGVRWILVMGACFAGKCKEYRIRAEVRRQAGPGCRRECP